MLRSRNSLKKNTKERGKKECSFVERNSLKKKRKRKKIKRPKAVGRQKIAVLINYSKPVSNLGLKTMQGVFYNGYRKIL